MPDRSPVLDAVERYRKQLEVLDTKALGRLVDNYVRSWNRLESMLTALLLEIGDEPMTRGQLMRVRRYRSLMEQITQELAGLQTLTGNEIEAAGQLGINLGGLHARELISTTIAGGPGLAAQFNVLPSGIVETLLGFLTPEGPLYDRLRLLAPTTTAAVAQAILEGVTLGFNPRKIAAMVQGAFGRGLTDALRFVRTAQLWSYRESTRATLVANSDIVEGWVWHSALDDRTCMSCIAMHGTIHPVTETLNDHHNGRCSMIPLVNGFDNPVTEIGTDWFSQQPEAVQRDMMGKGKFLGWKAGKFSLQDMIDLHEDDVYGPMRIEKPLYKLLDAKNAMTRHQIDKALGLL